MYQKGEIIRGVVSGIEPYGIFIKIDEDYSGLIHISEISNRFVRNINNYVKPGEVIKVKIIDIDDQSNHMNLSIKNIPYKIQINCLFQPSSYVL